MGKFPIVIVIAISLCWSMDLGATHNRAGEITIRQIGDLSIEVTVTTYTKTSSTQADRDSVRVFWGDGSWEYVYRINNEGTPLTNDRKLNYYVATHTYPGRASYTISMMDPNRNGGIINVNPPNSEGVPFYIEATYTFLNPQFQGYNNTAILLQPPIDFACVNQRYIHNPNAYDPDGDSLAFEFIVPLQDSGLNVPNYKFPQQVEPGLDNVMSLDPVRGDLVWTVPKIAGEYNVAFRVKEYRNGVLISSFIRDMQILVLVCDNAPPVIDAIEEICVIAGDTLDILIQVNDPNMDQLVQLTASGGPFEVNGNKAVLLNGSGGFQAPPYTARLQWIPGCERIRDQPYTVIIKAVDNFFDTTGLVDLHAIRIKVLGPAPEGLDLVNEAGAFQLSWDFPYACDVTLNDYFKGFSVWRRSGSNQFVPDSCENGLAGRGYTQIVANWKGTRNGRYHFEDPNVDEEGSYCYRVLAEFAQTTPFGQPYLRVVSIPSDEVCLRTNADLPLLTHVTVDQTDAAAGQTSIIWIAPDPSVLDTANNAGPYRYVLQFAPGIDGTNFQPVPGADFTSSTFAGLKDTTAIHTGIDTRNTGYSYRLDFFAGPAGELYGSSQVASSVFLSTSPSDEASELSWVYNTPWDNFKFDIWRSDQGNPFQKIATVEEDSYTDKAQVTNGLEYCYRITAYGDYGIMDIASPLLNESQVSCVIPFDNVPPCAPVVSVTNICDEANPGTPADAFINYVSWHHVCADDDIIIYEVYYSLTQGDEKVLVGEVIAPTKSFEHKPGERIAGCYAVIAVDQNGNRSPLSDQVCVANCPVFELPNAFTPNGDGQNDVFRPFRSRFIDAVNFSVYNQWGQLVYTTKDPEINWTGENNGGKAVSDGVYYFTCDAFEGLNQRPISLSGYIELIRG
jgi:gliding motility-associated-like protein